MISPQLMQAIRSSAISTVPPVKNSDLVTNALNRAKPFNFHRPQVHGIFAFPCDPNRFCRVFRKDNLVSFAKSPRIRPRQLDSEHDQA